MHGFSLWNAWQDAFCYLGPYSLYLASSMGHLYEMWDGSGFAFLVFPYSTLLYPLPICMEFWSLTFRLLSPSLRQLVLSMTHLHEMQGSHFGFLDLIQSTLPYAWVIFMNYGTGYILLSWYLHMAPCLIHLSPLWNLEWVGFRLYFAPLRTLLYPWPISMECQAVALLLNDLI